MNTTRFLVVGATGHVGSQVAINLANLGHDVTALVRDKNAAIRDPVEGTIQYVVGDLSDASALAEAVRGIDVVISTANGVVPQKGGGDAGKVNAQAIDFIEICERAGVKRFVQSSVPPYRGEQDVPELRGKRMIEDRLTRSTMQSVVIRNPAFMDVFLVFTGFRQAEARSAHATTKRQYGFGKMYLKMVGNLVEKYGVLIAPGGTNHGSPMIATRDVANMLVAGALYEGTDNLLIESGGPEWLTWQQIGDILAKKTGRRKLRIISMPSWMPKLNQRLVAPFSASAANTFALMSFVADFQPRWTPDVAINILKLPPLMTVTEYIDENYTRTKSK